MNILLFIWLNIASGSFGARVLQAVKAVNSADSDKLPTNQLLQYVIDQKEQWNQKNISAYKFNITSECAHCMEPFNLKQETVTFCDGRTQIYKLQYPNADPIFQQSFLQSHHNEPFYDTNINSIQTVFEQAIELSQLVKSEWDEIEIGFDPEYSFPYFIESITSDVDFDEQGKLREIGAYSYKYYVTDFEEISSGGDCVLN